MLNALTIDIEDWYQTISFTSILPLEKWNSCQSRIETSTDKILAMLKEHDVKATFFILGWIAERFPNLVLRIKEEGHEIASHGYSHRLVYDQTPEEFREDLKKSLTIIEEITRDKVLGYRAPNWSITKSSFWALDILEENKLKYDASIFPVNILNIYGISNMPRFPYVIRGDKDSSLFEFPPSTIRIGRRNWPLAGGIYLRLYPYWFTKWGIKKINSSGHPAIIYFHPWEIDTEFPKLKLPFLKSLIQYGRLETTAVKIEALLKDFKFGPIKKVIKIEGEK